MKVANKNNSECKDAGLGRAKRAVPDALAGDRLDSFT